MEGKKEGIKCDLCGTTNSKFLFVNHDRMFPEIKGTFNLYECEKCGLIYIYPQPSPKELSKHYPEKYSVFAKKDEINHLRRFFSLLESIYLYSQYKSDTFNYLKVFKAVFYPIKSLFRSTKIIEDGNLLDVGCGLGYFLVTMKNLGMVSYGVEPGVIDYELAEKYNLDIFNGNLLDAKFEDNFFDVITLNHVLEHIDNPFETIKELNRILKPGGYLIIRTPIADSYAFQLFGEYWGQIDTPRHLFIFKLNNLQKYGNMNNFKVENMRYCSIPSFQIISSIIYKLENLTNRKYDRTIFQNLFLNILFLPISAFLNIIKKSDECEIVFRKLD